MSRPFISFLNVDHGTEDWDDAIVTNFALIASLFGGPLPVGPEYAPSALPAADQYEACVGVVNDADSGWQLVLSDGVGWLVIGHQCVSQPDSSAETVVDLRAEFNALLQIFRDSGMMASS